MIGCSQRTAVATGFVLALLVLVASGCKPGRPAPAGPRGPGPGVPAKYAAAPNPSNIAPARALAFDPAARPWEQAGFAVIQTDLSPATLYFTRSNQLSLFAGLRATGLGAPSFMAHAAIGGPQYATNGGAFSGSKLNENWLLVWFAGAPGWTDWDSPWAVYLQHRPRTGRLDTNGLHLEFADAAGYVALLPLYGYYKPPQKDHEFRPPPGSTNTLPDRKLKTAEWTREIPGVVLQRLRYWAAALRNFPLYAEESFTVDRSRDAVVIRSRFDWLPIRDDWKTEPLKLAPVSPPLAFAWKDGRFPVEFSRTPFDMDLATPYGPYAGVQDTDSYEVTLPVLAYVNETEVADAAAITPALPGAMAALQKLRSMAPLPVTPSATEEQRCRLIASTRHLARALPYLEDPARSNLAARLAATFREQAFATNPAVPPSCALTWLEPLWAYAHFSGDWDLVRQHWPQVKYWLAAETNTSWAAFGRYAAPALGDKAAPALAYARLAWQAGDRDAYDYACLLFARELVHHHVQQRGVRYFREQQPWHSAEPMPDDVYVTALNSAGSGWQLDGPTYPAAAKDRLWTLRWERFTDPDVARFHRDFLSPDSRRELDQLAASGSSKFKVQGSKLESRRDPAGLPSLLQLRSLLLNAGAAAASTNGRSADFTGTPDEILGNCLAILRAATPTRWERLIPGGAPAPFVAGLEREAGVVVAGLGTALRSTSLAAATNRAAAWPRLEWPAWRTPNGQIWNFGEVRPTDAAPPTEVEVIPLNWNTRVLKYR